MFPCVQSQQAGQGEQGRGRQQGAASQELPLARGQGWPGTGWSGVCHLAIWLGCQATLAAISWSLVAREAAREGREEERSHLGQVTLHLPLTSPQGRCPG